MVLVPAVPAKGVRVLVHAPPLWEYSIMQVPVPPPLSVTPVSVRVVPSQTVATSGDLVAVGAEGGVQVLVATLIMPAAFAKKVSFVFVAVEELCPHVPATVPAPPSVNEFAVWLKAPRLATDPVVIEKLLVIARAELNVTAPAVLLKVRLFTVEGRPFPVFWAAVPL